MTCNTNRLLLFVAFFLITNLGIAQLTITEVGTLPEPVSNNAVCEAFIDGVPYVYSFGGINPSLAPAGIHLKCFRYNTMTGVSEQLPDLPDNMGKIAAAASRIGNIIYISGGYHVFPNFSELSSAKMHRFNVLTNSFLSDGVDIPVATDDHIQAVWRDSLIYLVTGWSNTANIPDVQIYNPATDSWLAGTPTPNSNDYKSFGASGTIIGDTIYYFGGARSTGNFPIQNAIRKGVIDPQSPTEINWSIEVPTAAINGYRMACTTVADQIHWVGGSIQTYNFDAIAYNGSGPVPPNNRDLWTHPAPFEWNSWVILEIPMDLRGIAEASDTVKYLAGGILQDRTVTNKVYRLEWNGVTTSVKDINANFSIKLSPNPAIESFEVLSNLDLSSKTRVEVRDMNGVNILTKPLTASSTNIDCSQWASGVYVIIVRDGNETLTQKIVKL